MAAAAAVREAPKMQKLIEKCIANSIFTEEDAAEDAALMKILFEPDDWEEILHPEDINLTIKEASLPGKLESIISYLRWRARTSTEKVCQQAIGVSSTVSPVVVCITGNVSWLFSSGTKNIKKLLW
jgi:hypothetical protein